MWLRNISLRDRDIESLFNPKTNKYQQYFPQKHQQTKHLGNIPKDVIERIKRLRLAFDVIENIGAGTEFVSLILSPFTAGASLPAAYVGLGFNILGTTGNVAIDLYLYKQTGDPTYYQAAYKRALFFGADLGVGKIFQLGEQLLPLFMGQFINFVTDKGLKPEFIKTKY